MTLNGTWINEYGSEMQLKVDETGLITGSYKSTTGATGTYRVVGVSDAEPVNGVQTMAFCISWRPEISTEVNESDNGSASDDPVHWCSGFTGRLYRNENNIDELSTTYLLTRNSDMAHQWESTVVDKCTYHRAGNN